MNNRLMMMLACGSLAACTSGNVTIPEDASVIEVPSTGTTSSFGGGPLPPGVQVAPPGISTAVAAPGIGRPLDTDTLNLMQTTLEEQKIDAAAAERKLAADRARLVIVQPGSLPNRVEGVNLAEFAQRSTHALGTGVYGRSGTGFSAATTCRRFSSPDEAQRTFLANGGPGDDRYGIDPDGDGFACAWDPTPYRQLRS